MPYSSDATWSEPLSDVIPPLAAKVERPPLDDDARDRIEWLNILKARPLTIFVVVA